MHVDTNSTYSLLEINIEYSKDVFNNNDRLLRPKGIIIQDSYNNPFFPIQPEPKIDTYKLNLPKLYNRFRELYSLRKATYLPFHYCIEMIETDYYAFNTRPINIKFPLKNKNVKDVNFTPMTRMFFEKNNVDISDCIHVCILGDSESDIYTKKLYKAIAQLCVTPFIDYFKISKSIYNRICFLNLSSSFKPVYLENYLSK